MPGPRAKKILSFVLMSIVGLTIGVVVSFWIALKTSTPVTDGTLSLDGLQHPVEITFDSMGVCQIWAQTV